MNKLLVAIVIIVLAILAFMYWSPATTPSEDLADFDADTTNSISADIETVVTEDLESDFSELNMEIEGL